METIQEQQVKNSDLEKAKIELALFKRKSEAEFQRDKAKWTNRRRMAWVSLSLLILMTVYLFHYMELPRIEALKGIIEWTYTVFATVVLAYLGFATWQDVKKG